MRWYGPPKKGKLGAPDVMGDPIPVKYFSQVPALKNGGGIVSALYHLPIGEVWPVEDIEGHQAVLAEERLEWKVVESIAVHIDILFGSPTRDVWIEKYIRSLENVARCNIRVVCYNVMLLFDWFRSDLRDSLPDGSYCLSYDDAALAQYDLSKGTKDLPGWSTTYDTAQFQKLHAQARTIDPERYWANVSYFLERVIPEAEKLGVKMALHPDDPPWPIFGIPRIITNEAALRRYLEIVDSPSNGLTFCTGSLGASEENADLPGMVRRLGHRIHFAHLRNVKRNGPKKFKEVPHPPSFGDVDLYAVLKAYHDVGFTGPGRSDHGLHVFGEEGRPGYPLVGRSLGTEWLSGAWEAISRA